MEMRIMSVFGLLALLGIAWALSYHHSKVRMKTVLWGIGLQFLFAVAILRKDSWSFVAMSIFALLVMAYILRDGAPHRAPGWGKAAIWITGLALAGFLGGRFASPALGWILLALVVIMIANSYFEFAPSAQRPLGALFVTLGAALLISRGFYGQIVFDVFSSRVAGFLSLSDYGARFLFGNLADGQYFFTGPDAGWPGFGFQFAFKVLPTIIFFGGFMGVLYYLGLMQKVIEAMAGFMRWTVGTSGAETLSCSANIFVGQTEAPLLIKPFLDEMTDSELLTIMVGGFATIAGGVLAGYIAMGVPAGHLIAASVMSAPAALVIGKIMYPETEQSKTAGDVEMPDIDVGGNVIEAATNGITDGFKLALNVGAMLIGFIALIAVVDVSLNWMDSMIDGAWLHGAYRSYGTSGMSPAEGEFVGFFPGSLQTIFGTLLKPLAFLMGVPWVDAEKVANLLGIKLSLNEFVAYGTLGNYIKTAAISERSIIIATYALCGFANFSSIGIQIGGISAVAPKRKGDLARLGLKAMIGGALASWTTATIAGMLL